MNKVLFRGILDKLDKNGFYNVLGFVSKGHIKDSMDNINVKKVYFNVNDDLYECKCNNLKSSVVVSGDAFSAYFEISYVSNIPIKQKNNRVICSGIDEFYGKIIVKSYY